MSTDPTARIALRVWGALFLGFAGFLSWTLWEARGRTVSLAAPPLALRDDATALAFAHTALREAGYDPTVFAPPPPGSRHDSAPDLRRFDFFPASGAVARAHPGVHVRLEQQGATVVCDVARKK